jgi:hypothetical protein
MKFNCVLLLMAWAATAILASCTSPSVKSDQQITLPTQTSVSPLSSTATRTSEPERQATLPTANATATAYITLTPSPVLTAQGTLALVNGTLVDGTSAEAIPNASVVI